MSVVIEFSTALSSRLGVRGTYVRVSESTTVMGLVEQLAEQFGSSVRRGLLTEERLRRDAVVTRESSVASEHLGPESTVTTGDRIRFEL